MTELIRDDVRYREASSQDVPAIERSRTADLVSGPADARMAAYLDGRHHPQQALAPRTAFLGTTADDVVGYSQGTRRRATAVRLNRYWYIWEDVADVLAHLHKTLDEPI